MKYFCITLLVLATSMFLAKQPAKGYSANRSCTDAESIIIDFLRKVYETQDDALRVAHQYIKLDDSPGLVNELSIDKRYEIAAENIILLREGKGISSFSPPLNKKELDELQVVPYTSLISTGDNKLLEFQLADNQSQNLYVVLKNNFAWKYFYVKNNRIYSFDYILKGQGGPAYLFSY